MRALRKRVPQSMRELHAQLDLTSELIRQGHQEARHSISMLRPSGSKDGAHRVELITALISSARRTITDDSIQLATTVIGEQHAVPLRIIDVLLRVGQECLANIVRHASATCITITVHYQPRQVILHIQDNGVGMQHPQVSETGLGLKGVHERVQSVRGTVQISTPPEGGTRLTACIPLPHARRGWTLIGQRLYR